MMLSEITTSGFVYTIISFAKIIVLLSENKRGVLWGKCKLL